MEQQDHIRLLDNVILTCTVTGTYLQWINPVNTENSITLSNSATSGVIGDFTVTFVSSISNVVKSEARLQFVSFHHNGSSIICKNVFKNVRQQRNIIVFGKFT